MHQFLHYATYGEAPRKGAGGWATIEGVLAEASRMPGAVGHLPAPSSPQLLFGVTPIALEFEALWLCDEARDACGRRCRRDAAILVAGVASYPVARAEVEKSPDEQLRFDDWCASVIAWLRLRHGDQLRSVVLHDDERYLHLHFYTLPRLHPDRTIDWTGAHPGIEAKRWSAVKGEDSKDGDAEYRLAMRKFQDDFYEKVSAALDHARFGPARQRENRRVAKRCQDIDQAACALADQLERAEAELAKERERSALARQAAVDAEEARATAQADIAKWAGMVAQIIEKRQRAQHARERIGGRAVSPIHRRLLREQEDAEAADTLQETAVRPGR